MIKQIHGLLYKLVALALVGLFASGCSEHVRTADEPTNNGSASSEILLPLTATRAEEEGDYTPAVYPDDGTFAINSTGKIDDNVILNSNKPEFKDPQYTVGDGTVKDRVLFISPKNELANGELVLKDNDRSQVYFRLKHFAGKADLLVLANTAYGIGYTTKSPNTQSSNFVKPFDWFTSNKNKTLAGIPTDQDIFFRNDVRKTRSVWVPMYAHYRDVGLVTVKGFSRLFGKSESNSESSQINQLVLKRIPAKFSVYVAVYDASKKKGEYSTKNDIKYSSDIKLLNFGVSRMEYYSLLKSLGRELPEGQPRAIYPIKTSFPDFMKSVNQNEEDLVFREVNGLDVFFNSNEIKDNAVALPLIGRHEKNQNLWDMSLFDGQINGFPIEFFLGPTPDYILPSSNTDISGISSAIDEAKKTYPKLRLKVASPSARNGIILDYEMRNNEPMYLGSVPDGGTVSQEGLTQEIYRKILSQRKIEMNHHYYVYVILRYLPEIERELSVIVMVYDKVEVPEFVYDDSVHPLPKQ